MAGGAALLQYRPASRTLLADLVFYGLFGTVAIVAMGLGVRLLLGNRRNPPQLPRPIILGGAILLLVAGLGNIAVALLVPRFLGYLVPGLVLGFGGSCGAFQLWRARGQAPPHVDGA